MQERWNTVRRHGEHGILIKSTGMKIPEIMIFNTLFLQHCIVDAVMIIFFSLAEIAMKARKEIADFLQNNKFDRARIRVRFFFCAVCAQHQVHKVKPC